MYRANCTVIILLIVSIENRWRGGGSRKGKRGGDPPLGGAGDRRWHSDKTIGKKEGYGLT